MRLAVMALMLVGFGASAAVAQTHVGANVEGGIPWSVAAPQGASWSLVCRFSPVTYEVNRYNRHRWSNKMSTTGAGPDRGRLPDQDGNCTVTKTGGPGPVAIAMVRGAEVVTGVTTDTAHPAAVGFL